MGRYSAGSQGGQRPGGPARRYGSKNIYVRKRAKGTERSDLADQNEGVKMFFGDEPEMPMCYEPKQMDLAVMPCIDGWFKTEVKPMGQFEASYQSYHSMMNFFGLNQLLCGKCTGNILHFLYTLPFPFFLREKRLGLLPSCSLMGAVVE